MDERWTGVVRLDDDGRHIGSVLLWRGRLAWATSRFVDADLASTLQSEGAIDDAIAGEIRAHFQTFGKLRALGQWLEERGYTSRTELRRQLRNFARRVLRSLNEREGLVASTTAHTLEADSEMTFGWDELVIEDSRSGDVRPRPLSEPQRSEPVRLRSLDAPPQGAPRATSIVEPLSAPPPSTLETLSSDVSWEPHSHPSTVDENHRSSMSWNDPPQTRLSKSSDPWAVLEGRCGAHLITVVSVKGGLGKTSAAINLSVAFAELDRQTVLIDCDPNQGVDVALDRTENEDPGLWDFLSGQADPQAILRRTKLDKLDIVSAGRSEVAVHDEFARILDEDGFEALRSTVTDAADLVVVDTPSGPSRCTKAALRSADFALVPVTVDQASKRHLMATLRLIESIRRGFNPALVTLLFPVRVAAGQKEMLAQLRAAPPGGVVLLESVLPLSDELPLAEARGLPVAFLGGPPGEAAAAYSRVAAELIEIVCEPEATATGSARAERRLF